METWTCGCGHVVEGKSEAEVSRKVMKHIKNKHPEMDSGKANTDKDVTEMF